MKIADFGIARALEETMVTQIGTVLGTMRYLAPEQAEGRVVGTEADVYSLGVVFDELLADATDERPRADRRACARHDPAARPDRRRGRGGARARRRSCAPTRVATHRPRACDPLEGCSPSARRVAIVAAIVVAAPAAAKAPARVEPVPHATTPAQQARNLSAWLKTYSR